MRSVLTVDLRSHRFSPTKIHKGSDIHLRKPELVGAILWFFLATHCMCVVGRSWKERMVGCGRAQEKMGIRAAMERLQYPECIPLRQERAHVPNCGSYSSLHSVTFRGLHKSGALGDHPKPPNNMASVQSRLPPLGRTSPLWRQEARCARKTPLYEVCLNLGRIYAGNEVRHRLRGRNLRSVFGPKQFGHARSQ